MLRSSARCRGRRPVKQLQFPATVKVADSLPVPLEDEFAFGLELIIDGLTQALARQPRPRKAQRRNG
jgi:hypothetical protein